MLTSSYLVADLNQHPSLADLEFATIVNDKLLFHGGRENTGIEIWSSDGSEAGTGLLFDINEGSASNRARGFTTSPTGDMTYFLAEDSIRRSLWRTDGEKLDLVFPGEVEVLAATDTGVFFSEGTYLPSHRWLHDVWFADANLNRRHLGTYFDGVYSFGVVDDQWVFGVGCSASASGLCQVWQTEGSPSTTIQLGVGHTNRADVVEFLGKHYLISDVATEVLSDGLGSPIDIPGSFVGATSQSLVFRDESHFLGLTEFGAEPEQLYSTRITDFASAEGIGDYFFFVDRDGGVWQSDGTASGTILRFESERGPIRLRTVTSNILVFAEYSEVDSEVTIRALDQDSSTILASVPKSTWWQQDGIEVVADDSRLFFSTHDSQSGSQLWTVDLDDEVPVPQNLGAIWDGTNSSRVLASAYYEDQVLISADSNGSKFFATNGTLENTDLVSPNSFFPTRIYVAGQKLFMIGRDNGESFGIWFAENGIDSAENLNKKFPDLRLGRPRDAVLIENELVFVNERTDQIWRTDGSSEGTRTEIELSHLAEYRIANNAIHFRLRRDDGSSFEAGQWYRTDGTLAGTVPITDAEADWGVNGFEIGGRRFRLDDSMGWRQLLSGGTELPAHGERAYASKHAIRASEDIFFLAQTEPSHNEWPWFIFRLDGQNGRIEKYFEFEVNPDFLQAVDGKLVFSRYDDFHGSEIWAAPLRPDGDVDGDVVSDVDDIDALCSAIRHGDMALRFDVNHDSVVDFQDYDDLIHEVLHTTYGDSDLNRAFESTDLVRAFLQGRYNKPAIPDSQIGWASGDWNCDGQFDTSDLIYAFRDGGFASNASMKAQATDQSFAEFAASITKQDSRYAFVA